MRRRYRAQFPDVLEPVSSLEFDPAGNRWPTIDEIEDLHGFVRWELDADHPSTPWGWAWLIDRTRHLACEELTIAPADWTRLSQATNPRFATAAALFAMLRPDRPPFRTDRQFLKHVAEAFNSTAPVTDPYRDAVEHICTELHGEIELWMERDGHPGFVYSGPLPHLTHLQRIHPYEPDWPAFMYRARQIVRRDWRCIPSWEFARAMIGSERSSAAVLAACFAESIRHCVSLHKRPRPDHLFEPEARTFAYLVITEYRERGFLVEHIRDLATTRHVPGRIIRTRHETQRGSAT